jgi:hypothetical protein
MARKSPLQRPTPTVEPVMQCVVEIGSLSCVARIIVITEPSELAKPREGD